MAKLIQNATLNDVTSILNRFLRESDSDPHVARLAQQAVEGKEDQVGAVFDFVRDTFPYQLDSQIIPTEYPISNPQETEYFQHPRRVAQDFYAGKVRSGDCDDKATLAAAMLRNLGYNAKVTLVATNQQGEISHVVTRVETPSGPIEIDTTDTVPLGWYRDYSKRIQV